MAYNMPSMVTYFYYEDFTNVAERLLTIQAGGLLESWDAFELMMEFRRRDKGVGKDLWNTETNTRSWSLATANVLYNGKNRTAYPTKGNKKYVLILSFGDLTSDRLYVVYNDPIPAPVGE